eukprot:scaffold4599_cov138-Skeletonema_menzelii.AAC.12
MRMRSMEKRPVHYERGLDQFFTKLFTTSVLYFLELPSHTFGEENHQVDAGDVGEQEGHEVERGNHLDDLNGDDDELEETYQEGYIFLVLN